MTDNHKEIVNILDHLNFSGIAVYMNIVAMNKDPVIGLTKMADKIWVTSLFDDFKRDHRFLDFNLTKKTLSECLSNKLFSFITSLT